LNKRQQGTPPPAEKRPQLGREKMKEKTFPPGKIVPWEKKKVPSRSLREGGRGGDEIESGHKKSKKKDIN